MSERHTRICPSQIEGILPNDLVTETPPTDGQVAKYDSVTGKFVWGNVASGGSVIASDIYFTIYGDAFVTGKIVAFAIGAELDGKQLKTVLLKADIAPVGSNLVCDINKNGTTMFTTQANRPKILDGQYSSTSAIPDVQTVATGDLLSLDIDSVGLTVPGGNNLYVTLHFS